MDTKSLKVTPATHKDAGIRKQLDHTWGIFWLFGFTNINIVCLNNRYHKARYQLAQSSLGFPFQPRAHSCERSQVVNYEQHQNHEHSTSHNKR